MDKVYTLTIGRERANLVRVTGAIPDGPPGLYELQVEQTYWPSILVGDPALNLEHAINLLRRHGREPYQTVDRGTTMRGTIMLITTRPCSTPERPLGMEV